MSPWVPCTVAARRRGATARLAWPASLLMTVTLWAPHGAAESTQGWGASLFAATEQAGRTTDSERALAVTAFYSAVTSKASHEPGTLVRAEAATDLTLPPGVAATRILYHTRTDG
jgi:hypothetical protein